ncbi:MAG: glycosyltransferase family 2 protein [Bacteroidia bacterium]
MFSIIIPLYNKAPFVEKAIRSVAAQTFQEFELIIIDDGSTDDSFSIAQRALSSLTPPLGGWGAATQQNSGVSTTRNNGVKLAKYDYIAFLDADDWWESDFLEEMNRLVKEYPDASIYGSSYYIVKNGQKRIAPIGIETGFEKGYINYCQVYAKTLCMPLTSISVIIPKSIFELENGFNPTIKLGEDFDLWLRIAMKYPVFFLNIPLANYNQDVELKNRAIGEKFYEPQQHMLFKDYGELNNNSDFRRLIEDLAVYGLIPYYLAGKNKTEVNTILSRINWKNHAFKYRLYYKYLPKPVVKFWFKALKLASKCKSILIKYL